MSSRCRLIADASATPEKSGIADYSAELVPQLARFYDVEVIVAQERVSAPWIEANLPLRSLDWFEAHADQFDRLLYHFGNSPMHRHMFALLERHPGIVVLHDFYLCNVLHHLEHTGYLPGAFGRALYHAHGFFAFADRQAIGLAPAVWKYPCNKAVLDQASGVIVHANYPRQLASQWYGPHSVAKWRTLPLLRGKDGAVERAAARRALGLAADAFVVCAFGMLGPTKLNDALLDAWLASPLAADPACRLIFVGANDPGAYGAKLLRQLAGSAGAGAAITGFVSHDDYARHLAASDAAVQLRTQSRGETSAAILDCLLHGVPTIANAHGSSAELPDAVLCKLPDQFTQGELVDALVRLRTSAKLRAALSASALDYIEREHAPEAVGRQYHAAIEDLAGRDQRARLARALVALAPAAADLTELALAVGANAPREGPRQLLVDISALVRSDLKTGIQRVVRSVLKALLEAPPAGYRVEPVYSAGAGAPYRYARHYMAGELGAGELGLDDAPVDAGPGELFLGLDLFTHGTCQNQARLQHMRARGVQVYFVVYDILPLLRPAAFPAGAEADFQAWLPTVAAVSDGLVCISRVVADDVARFLEARPAPARRPLRLGYFHLGADIAASIPSAGLPEAAEQILEQVAARPSMLMVGTLEPRKGHAQALAAFELLWAEDVPVNLVIVGKAGWMVEALVARLRQHPARGSKLFWLEGASDEMLLKLYGAAACLLAASEAEGFGLPLIEAAQHALPIVARRLPVFQEVAAEHAYYFDASNAPELAAALRAWLALRRDGAAPGSAALPWLDWNESTAELRNCIIEQRWYRTLFPAAPCEPDEPADPDEPCEPAEPAEPPAGAGQRQLLVDVSAIVRNDLHTGIERVVRAQLGALLHQRPAGWRVEPVYLSDAGGSWHYRYARRYARELFGAAARGGPDSAFEPAAGDLLYCPDFCPDALLEAAAQGLYAQWRARGVQLNFLIHDLLPISQPAFFPEPAAALHARWLGALAAHADRLICISQAVADELAQWLRAAQVARTPSIAVLHHGADLEATAPSAGLPPDAEATLAHLAEGATFLMVGTLEPRKGHLQALRAFEHLWRAGSTARLVIVGREGWHGLPEHQRRTIPHLLHRLRHHPERGQRLFWLADISDEYLQRLYQGADCLLVASEGEGFGLPLIEAARAGLPILARELPVFREVAGQAATYFSGLDAADLAAALGRWLALREQGATPAPGALP